MKKLTTYSGIAALFILLASGRCKNSNNDLLVKLYNRSYTSMVPLKTTKEPVYKPLLGYWNLMGDRPLAITQKDPNTYELRFLSPYLSKEDVVYPAHITTIGKNRYINMQGYKGGYMFFKAGNINEDNSVILNMITAQVEERLGTGNLFQYLTKHPNVPDTSGIWYPVPLQRMTASEALLMQQTAFKKQVSDIGDYDRYQERFPEDTALPALKNKAIRYSVTNASSVKEIITIRDRFPETADLIGRTARKKCTSTIWCIDYVAAFPNDPAKDSILNVAFSKADSKSDYVHLLKNVPLHPEAGRISFQLASAVYKESDTNDERQRIEVKYAELPAVITLVNTMRLFDNAAMNESAFLKNSYQLSAKGQEELNQFVQLAASMNKDSRTISDMYVLVAMAGDFPGNTAKSNFLQSANKALAIKNYLHAQSNGKIAIHCIPVGSENMSGNNNDQVKLTLHAETAQEWKNLFYKQCFATGQTEIVPDGKREPVQTAFIRVQEVENKIIRDFEKQIAFYKDKQAFERVIPPNYWNTTTKAAQPGFDEFQLRLKAAAKAQKLKSKRIALFVIQQPG